MWCYFLIFSLLFSPVYSYNYGDDEDEDGFEYEEGSRGIPIEIIYFHRSQIGFKLNLLEGGANDFA